jgi:hypothetical protein
VRPFLAAALLALLSAGGCAQGDRPYRFTSPMLGTADLPRTPLRADPAAPRPRPELANRDARPIRVVSAPQIREASAAAAAAIALPDAPAPLPTPHRVPPSTVLPAVREAPDLRALVGYRDKRDPHTAILSILPALGRSAPATLTDQLSDPTELAAPGDLLIFDRAVSDADADLIAIVIGRDTRGVTEYVYLGGGVYRRGFVDPARPATRRDREGLVVNTFLRHGKRWPAKGSHYLAGELLAHVLHTR